MLVSIIVPIYNVEKYITRCFNSIIKQTYYNIECIFIDDCSPDDSIYVLNDLINKYNGNISLRIIKHEKNGGLSVARNTGINNAKGEYIYFLDSDDEITEHCIKYLAKLAEKYKNVDIVQGNIKREPCDLYNQWDIAKRRFPEYTNKQLWLRKRFFEHPRIPVTAWNKLIKHSFITENALYFKEGIIHEDEHWNFFAAKKIRTMAFTNQYCYIYYDNPDSIVHSNKILIRLQSGIIIIRDMLENIDVELQREERKYIYYILYSCIYKTGASIEYQQLLPEYRKIIKLCIKNSRNYFDFISYFGLLLFLLPYRIYSNYVFRILTKLLLSNWKNFFSFNWRNFNF